MKQRGEKGERAWVDEVRGDAWRKERLEQQGLKWWVGGEKGVWWDGQMREEWMERRENGGCEMHARWMKKMF